MSIDSETVNIRAALVNSGCYSIQEADAKLESSAIYIELAADAALTTAGQAAFLTAVATASRCFGVVEVGGDLDAPLAVPLPVPVKSLADAAIYFEAQFCKSSEAGRQILIGGTSTTDAVWAVRTFWDGWVAGAAPATLAAPVGRSDNALAGIAAGALAVGQAFLAEQGDPRAGRFKQALSLWSPDLAPADAGNPELSDISLPRTLWLIGLGNLGQAYLWSLFSLPYADPTEVLLYLQDDDSVTKTNWGTSLLVERGRYGLLKNKVAEEWADRRRFNVRRIDRRLDGTCRVRDREPRLALSGVDRMEPRRLLGLSGFDYIIDCGLGATYATYQDIRLNVFDQQSHPAEHFEGVEDRIEETVSELLELPAYKELAKEQNDDGCGAAMLAEKSVAVPFVSAFAATLAITQAIRLASMEGPFTSLTTTSGDLRTLRARRGPPAGRVTIETTEATSTQDITGAGLLQGVYRMN